VLLEHAPHLVLDGLALTAAAVGAREAHLYTSADVMPAVRRAVAERRAVGWDRLPVQLTEAPDTFLAGEKSAVVNAIEGRPAIPRDHPISLTRSGLRGRPTLVHNVETLAHVALIARYGPNWFRGVGDQSEPGTMLVTLSCAAAPSVVEVPTGMALARLLDDHTSIDPADVRALLLGGYHGTWISGTDAAHADFSRMSLSPLGSAPGAGVVQILARDECGLRRSADIVTYLAAQSARQCGPCLNGLPALANILTDLAYRQPRPDSVGEITRLAALVEGRGACKHPDGTARFLRSTMSTFSHDVELHLRGTCEAAYLEREPRNLVNPR
jgi:NADH:ubiquinone oxidoreductase subunit F (NADH-binding)